MSLDGEWRGFYEYDDKSGLPVGPQPILAKFQTEGFQLSGLMEDENTKTEVRYRDTFEGRGAELSFAEQAQALAFLKEYPDASFQTLLPKESDLVGEFRSPNVFFWKIYRGKYIHQWVFG